MKYNLLILTLLFALACGSNENGKIPQETVKVKIDKFNADTCFAFIRRQVDFGKRYVNSQSHQNCKNWLEEKLKSYGFEVISQDFVAQAYNGSVLKGTNLIGRHNALVEERLLLCAHYDTRHIADKDTIKKEEPIEGADDGASGVAVILEIARQIHNNPIPMGIDLIFFDAEDYGSDIPGDDYSWGLGSQYWSKNMHEKNYTVRYGILLDMVGSRNATFPKEGFSLQYATNQVNKIWNLAKIMGHEEFFVKTQVGYYTDDHRFIIENTNIPMVDVINIRQNGQFGTYHHTHADNLEIIDKKTLQAVGQVILATIYNESNGDEF